MHNFLASPSAVALSTLLLTAVVLQISSDFKEAKINFNIKRQLTKLKSSPRTTVSVLIEATNDGVFETLQSLEQNEYQYFEPIIFVKSRSKNLLKNIRSYKRTSKFNKLRIITARRGLTQSQLLNKYARGSVVMSLSSGELIDTKFIKRHIALFRDNRIDIIAGNTSHKMSESLLSAMQESKNNFIKYISSNKTVKLKQTTRLLSGVLYRKNTLSHDVKTSTQLDGLEVNRSFVLTKSPQRKKFKSRMLTNFVPIVIITAVLFIVTYFEGKNQAVLTFRVFGFVMIATGLLAWPKDSFTNTSKKLSLALLTPFVILPKLTTNKQQKV